MSDQPTTSEQKAQEALAQIASRVGRARVALDPEGPLDHVNTAREELDEIAALIKPVRAALSNPQEQGVGLSRDDGERLELIATRIGSDFDTEFPPHADARADISYLRQLSQRALASPPIADDVERLREKLLSDEAVEVALIAEGAVAEAEQARGEVTPDKSERMTRAGLEAAFDIALAAKEGSRIPLVAVFRCPCGAEYEEEAPVGMCQTCGREGSECERIGRQPSKLPGFPGVPRCQTCEDSGLAPTCRGPVPCPDCIEASEPATGELRRWLVDQIALPSKASKLADFDRGVVVGRSLLAEEVKKRLIQIEAQPNQVNPPLEHSKAENAELEAANEAGFDEVLKLREELEAMTDARDLCKRQTAQANERLEKTREAWQHEKERADTTQSELDRERRRKDLGPEWLATGLTEDPAPEHSKGGLEAKQRAEDLLNGSSPEAEAGRVLRKFMCCPAGREFVEHALARPFGLTLAPQPNQGPDQPEGSE